MQAPPSPLGILLSAPALEKYGERILSAVEPLHSVRLMCHYTDKPLPDDEIGRVHVAYVSPELIGRHDEADPERRPRAFHAELRRAHHLQWLHVCSAGTDRPIYRELHERGVTVTHSAGANAVAVAHTALAGMLALLRDVPSWVRMQDQRRWRTQRHEDSRPDLDGTTVVIVGTGAIGQALARACRALEMRVLGVRRRAAPVEHFDAVYSHDQLPEVLPQADWLVLACPLTPETYHMIDAEQLALLPSQARLINVGRGPLVNEAAMLAALQSGRLAGVYSDVFEQEPLPAESPLWTAPNMLISAHSAGAVQGFGERATARFISNLQAWLGGEPMQNVASFPPLK